MPTYEVQSIVDGQPTFGKPLSSILSGLKVGGAIRTLDPIEYITDRQRRWYKGICLRDLAKYDENGETTEWWDCEVKKLCGGLSYLKRDIFFIEDATGGKVGVGRLTTKGVGKRNMTAFIEEILSQAMQRGWPVSEPDPELRS
jgi:hypothetical protein